MVNTGEAVVFDVDVEGAEDVDGEGVESRGSGFDWMKCSAAL